MRSPALFSKNLEAIREFNDRSIAEFALEIGIAKSTLHSVRISGGNTTLDTAIRIADGLNLPLDSLVGDDHLPEKVNLVQHLLQSVDWFSISPAVSRRRSSSTSKRYWRWPVNEVCRTRPDYPAVAEGRGIVYYTYFAFKRKYSTPETGIYCSFDIAVYGPLYRRPVQVVRDVTTDGELMFRLITAFNESALSPIHLMDAVQDFLSLE